MGDISVIARRLGDGHIQHGWSGNGGYHCMVGARLLEWYQKPEDVEYLFELGQTALIGRVGSERGGCPFFETHGLTHEPFWVSDTERKMFTKIAFIDYGYFYDLDNRWYYIIPGPFRIKVPLELIDNNLNEKDYEFDFKIEIEKKIAEYIFNEYIESDSEFKEFFKEKNYDPKEIFSVISETDWGQLYKLYDEYKDIYEYFDDWIVIRANSEYTKITEIVMRKKEEVHLETNLW